jgi:hypothetical protein
MWSDDEYFLGTQGITIYNNRNQSDMASVYDNKFYELESVNGYPKVEMEQYPDDRLYGKKGEKY